MLVAISLIKVIIIGIDYRGKIKKLKNSRRWKNCYVTEVRKTLQRIRIYEQCSDLGEQLKCETGKTQ